MLSSRLGTGLDDAALAKIKAALARAADGERDAKHGTAWRAHADVLALAPAGPRAETSRAGQKRALESLAAPFPPRRLCARAEHRHRAHPRSDNAPSRLD